MNIVKLAIALAATSVSSYATISLSGTALLRTPGTAAGDAGVVLVDLIGQGFSASTISFVAGESISIAESYGQSFALITPVKTFGGNASNWAFNASTPVEGVTLGGQLGQGDRFAIVTFSLSTTVALAGDTFTVWTDPLWVIPADGSGFTFSATPGTGIIPQLGASSVPLFTGIVSGSAVPEPSSFAAIAGLGILGAVVTRRRRSA